MTQYWVVGAWWGGVDDRTELFVEKGYDVMGDKSFNIIRPATACELD